MVEHGVLERFGIERAFGLHYGSTLPVGVLGTRPGPFMASADSFEVEIVGRGGHGSAPHLSSDPIAASAETIVALQQIVSRRIDPLEPAVVSVCSMHSGTTYNVIPSTAKLQGTLRAFNEDVRAELKRQIEHVCTHAAATAGATAHVKIIDDGFPVTANDPDQAAYILALAAATVGEERVVEAPPVMGAEDFSYFAQRVPACFFFVGSNGGESTAFMNHHGRFDLDERAFVTGIKVMTAIALDAPRNAP
jgi:hippurate hydrolase